jgi:signal peptidase I
MLTSGMEPGGTWVALAGRSMEPTFAAGDRLLVAPIARWSGALRPGEVVVARRGERLVAHRLVGFSGPLVITQGDACPRTDPPIPIEGVIGRVVGVRRRPGPVMMVRRLVRRLRSFPGTTSGGSHE